MHLNNSFRYLLIFLALSSLIGNVGFSATVGVVEVIEQDFASDVKEELETVAPKGIQVKLASKAPRVTNSSQSVFRNLSSAFITAEAYFKEPRFIRHRAILV